jgi:hypothetical protein
VELINTSFTSIAPLGSLIISDAVLRILASEDCCKINDILKHKEKSLILNCVTGTGTTLFGGPSFLNPLPLATVQLDTTSLRSAVVNLNFSCIIAYASGIYTFQLSKICTDGMKILLGTWNYSPNASSGLSYSFCFSLCEHLNHTDCCEYIVDLVNYTNPDSAATIANVDLTALAAPEP